MYIYIYKNTIKYIQLSSLFSNGGSLKPPWCQYSGCNDLDDWEVQPMEILPVFAHGMVENGRMFEKQSYKMVIEDI